jgi:hypothetical protein
MRYSRAPAASDVYRVRGWRNEFPPAWLCLAVRSRTGKARGAVAQAARQLVRTWSG